MIRSRTTNDSRERVKSVHVSIDDDNRHTTLAWQRTLKYTTLGTSTQNKHTKNNKTMRYRLYISRL